MLKLLREDFQLAMVVFLCGCAVVAIAPFSVLRILHGEWLVAAVDATIVLGMTFMLVYALRTQKTRLISALITLFYTVFAVVIVYLRVRSTVFWLYPVVIANFFLLSIRKAALINCLAIVAVIPLAPRFASSFEFFGALITLLLVNVMAAIFSWKTETQRQQLETLASHDPLTGLHNRRSMDAAVTRLLARKQRDHEPASLLILDLDHFKAVNDTFGHEAGDRVLREVAHLIDRRIRKGTDQVYRFGGEEFVVLLENTRLNDAVSLAEDLRTRLSTEIEGPGAPVHVSIGCAELNVEESREAWLERADCALYRAKNQGRNRVVAADSGPEQPCPCPETQRQNRG